MGGEDEVDGIIFQVERLRVVDLEVGDPAFWERHAGEWWAPLHQGYLTAPSDNLAYQAVTFKITVPEGWLRPLTEGGQASRAC